MARKNKDKEKEQIIESEEPGTMHKKTIKEIEISFFIEFILFFLLRFTAFFIGFTLLRFVLSK